jgi:hypothetical protein
MPGVLGDESKAYKETVVPAKEDKMQLTAIITRIYFRRDNIVAGVATVSVSAPAGFDEILNLARIVESRINGTAAPAPTAAPATSTPVPSPTPTIDLEVVQYHSKESYGSLYFMGELINNGSTDVSGVEIVIAVLDDNGGILGFGNSNSVDIDVAKVGQKYPFRVGIDPAPKKWAKEDIQITAKPYYGGRYYFDFKTQAVTVTADDGSYTITGKVVNVGDKAAHFVSVVAVLYDDAGKLLDVADTYPVSSDLAPGESSLFRIKFSLEEQPLDKVKYELHIGGRVD